ncbi:hypothetical protein PtA15_15A54 [Puccinia triticina]|uniref:BED-type domain-containing protein n=1 Tax=Puccinia triticina TaxID=208348 RepID=A0ABY7D240_9BASI|nr:uncharacterized protein PtA15_15A54 [Puccinia triticina]WAQ91664.1 hypothetical protein PtA15_15A54 [Puccinia triticina]
MSRQCPCNKCKVKFNGNGPYVTQRTIQNHLRAETMEPANRLKLALKQHQSNPVTNTPQPLTPTIESTQKFSAHLATFLTPKSNPWTTILGLKDLFKAIKRNLNSGEMQLPLLNGPNYSNRTASDGMIEWHCRKLWGLDLVAANLSESQKRAQPSRPHAEDYFDEDEYEEHLD